MHLPLEILAVIAGHVECVTAYHLYKMLKLDLKPVVDRMTDNDICMLDDEKLLPRKVSERFLHCICKHDSVRLLKAYLREKKRPLTWSLHLELTLARYCSFACLKVLQQSYCIERGKEICLQACRQGRLDILKWSSKVDTVNGLLWWNYSKKTDYNLIEYAAANGHLHIVKWLYNTFPGPALRLSEKCLYLAAATANLEIIKWLYARSKTNLEFPEAIVWAAWNGQYETCEWLLKEVPEPQNIPLALKVAAASGNLPLAKLLLQHTKKQKNTVPYVVYELAKSRSHEHVVEWLQTKSISRTTRLRKEVRGCNYLEKYIEKTLYTRLFGRGFRKL